MHKVNITNVEYQTEDEKGLYMQIKHSVKDYSVHRSVSRGNVERRSLVISKHSFNFFRSINYTYNIRISPNDVISNKRNFSGDSSKKVRYINKCQEGLHDQKCEVVINS